MIHNNIFTLPVEVVIRIIEFLDAKCIVHLSLSCKYLYLICTQPIYIRTININSWESLYSKAVSQDRILLPQAAIKPYMVGKLPCWKLVASQAKMNYKLKNQPCWDIPKPFQSSEWSEWDWSEKDPIPLDLQCYDPSQQYKESVDRGRQRLERLFKNNNNINIPRKHKKKSSMMVEIDERVRMEKESTSLVHEKESKEFFLMRKNSSLTNSHGDGPLILSDEENDSRKRIFEEAARIAKSKFLRVFSTGETTPQTRRLQSKNASKSPVIPKNFISDKPPKSRRGSEQPPASRKTAAHGLNKRTQSNNEIEDLPPEDINPTPGTSRKRTHPRLSSKGQKLFEGFRRSSKELDNDLISTKSRPTSPRGHSPKRSSNSRPTSPRGSVTKIKPSAEDIANAAIPGTSKSRPLSPIINRKEERIIIPRLPLSPISPRKQCRSISPRSLIKETAMQKKKSKEFLYLKRSFTETPPEVSLIDTPRSQTEYPNPLFNYLEKTPDRIIRKSNSTVSADIFSLGSTQLNDLLDNLNNMDKDTNGPASDSPVMSTSVEQKTVPVVAGSAAAVPTDDKKNIVVKVKSKSRDKSPIRLPLRKDLKDNSSAHSPRSPRLDFPPFNKDKRSSVQSAPARRRSQSRKEHHINDPSRTPPLIHQNTSHSPNISHSVKSFSNYSPPSGFLPPSSSSGSLPTPPTPPGGTTTPPGGAIFGGISSEKSTIVPNKGLPKSLVTLKTLSERRRGSRESSPFGSPGGSPRFPRKRTPVSSETPQKQQIDILN